MKKEATNKRNIQLFPNNKSFLFSQKGFIQSGWQDSNLRPPAPKAGAITGLRYTPKASANIKLIISSQSVLSQ